MKIEGSRRSKMDQQKINEFVDQAQDAFKGAKIIIQNRKLTDIVRIEVLGMKFAITDKNKFFELLDNEIQQSENYRKGKESTYGN